LARNLKTAKVGSFKLYWLLNTTQGLRFRSFSFCPHNVFIYLEQTAGNLVKKANAVHNIS